MNAALTARGSGELKEKTTLRDLLKRPELGYADVIAIAGDAPRVGGDEAERIEIEVTYEGYIRKAVREAALLAKQERVSIPPDFDYDLHNLALEARVKLKKIRPLTLGQAARISGVNPADVQALALRLKQTK